MGSFDFLNRMYKMAVRDNQGRVYLPVRGYDGFISHYAKAEEAIDAWIADEQEYAT